MDLGFPRAHIADLLGGTAEENAVTLRAILSGAELGPKRDIVVLNSAAVLSTEEDDWDVAILQVQESIDSGAALAKLEALVERSQQYA